MGITPRMRAAGGSAYGCLDTGCDSVTVYELMFDGVASGTIFDSLAAGRAYVDWVNEGNGPRCSCTLQLMSRPLQTVENSALPGFVKWFVGLFARHLMLDVMKADGSEELIEGWKNRKTNELYVRTLTNPDQIKEEKGNRSTNVGKPTSNLNLDALEQAANKFNPVPYHFVFGSNSNSAAHWLLDQAGLAGKFGPFGTPGWPHSAHQN
jgi:hypothetical protein